MRAEVGQLRRWNRGGDEVGSIFLVIGFTPGPAIGEIFVDYIMDGTHCWDDDDWVEKHSEVISEDSP